MSMPTFRLLSGKERALFLFVERPRFREIIPSLGGSGRMHRLCKIYLSQNWHPIHRRMMTNVSLLFHEGTPSYLDVAGDSDPHKARRCSCWRCEAIVGGHFAGPAWTFLVIVLTLCRHGASPHLAMSSRPRFAAFGWRSLLGGCAFDRRLGS